MVSVVFVSYWCLFPLARLCCETTLPRCGAGEDEVQQGRKKDRKIERERERVSYLGLYCHLTILPAGFEEGEEEEWMEGEGEEEEDLEDDAMED